MLFIRPKKSQILPKIGWQQKNFKASKFHKNLWLIAWFPPHVKENEEKKRTLGLDDLLDNTDESSRHIVMYDKQMHQIST